MSSVRSGVWDDCSFTLMNLYSKTFQTYDVHEASTKPLDTTVTMNDQKDWFLKVKRLIEESELLNSAKPLSTFHQDGPYICSECGEWLQWPTLYVISH